ncbi:NAD-dependent succinate-semialdehyde dehydrogenase [Maribellus luteus]|uniref:NAD-dependent succinate-semialdehyde dehydrogenase n=1 Tax=Maribellus luteus TaxID=2305463 RepID=A0A399T1J4_9BACT|nr:NAD-dependent succinate-semialdehyde dehydrogenase [Maribellus luteus]RIJ48662.1 NAD-dependent succinate-semialdehyde dehydrogenase [Maribellus luteus]
MLQSVNPTTGEVVKTYEAHTSEGTEKIINAVDKTWHHWRSTSFMFRSQLMQNLSGLLKSKREELAFLMALEMGKVKQEGMAEIDKCAWACDYYAANAESFLENEPIPTEAFKSYVSYQPIGTVLGIMPWNFPFWQVFRFVAPTLMAGNTAVLKHASNVPGCAIAIEELFREAGFPENVFRTLLIGSKQVEKVIRHKAIKAVSITGSTPAGKSVAAIAGSELKKCVLELGGSDPYIILEDADMELAAQKCAAGRLLNAGQSCIGAKRFIVEEKVYAHFLELFTHEMSAAVFGDPFDEDTTMGPLARFDLRDELHQQVVASVEKGAEVIIGGEIPQIKGAFYPPTILENVKPGMPAYDEELFGPVASVIKVKDLQEAVKVANDTEFGLGAAIFTANRSKGENIAEMRLEAGACFVNDFVKSDPRLPFGGIKTSGFGRELSVHGIKEFTNIKTVVVK